MSDSQSLRFRPPLVLAVGLIIFAVAFWLHAEAYDLSTRYIHMPDTPGTEKNYPATDDYQIGACVDAARVLMGLGAFLCAASAAAWLFVPTFRSALPSSKPRLKDDVVPVLGRSASVP